MNELLSHYIVVLAQTLWLNKPICTSLESVPYRPKGPEVPLCSWLKQLSTVHLSYFSQNFGKFFGIIYSFLHLSLFFNKPFKIQIYYALHLSHTLPLDDINIYSQTEQKNFPR